MADAASILNKPVDHAGGLAYQAPTGRKVTNGKTSPKSAMFDGPYGGKKPQS